MNSLAFLLVVSTIYYCLLRYFPERLNNLSPKHKYYFGGFIAIYLVIYYFFVYESTFVNKMFRNIYHSQQPLYSKNSAFNNAIYYNESNPYANMKSLLLSKQEHRCYKCSNYLMDPETDTKLSYKIPPKYGGKNEPHNLVVVCPTCSEFL